ncbi:MAG: HyaD/HybD family hydrogenase maturation endopeptidase [Deltaproteobacteria bacterium]|nr:HyaD/HybD family hydrogenase maturation endopeptidase [Deltaproteobacteria bacterium]
MTEAEKQRIVIMGVGNTILTDEGVGVRVLEILRDRYAFPANVNLVDGGTLGLSLLGVVEGADLLIVIDAVKNQGSPGTLYRLTWDDITGRVRYKDSMHQLDLVEALTITELIFERPEIIIIGVEPADISTPGLSLTPMIQEKTQDMVQMVLAELSRRGISHHQVG